REVVAEDEQDDGRDAEQGDDGKDLGRHGRRRCCRYLYHGGGACCCMSVKEYIRKTVRSRLMCVYRNSECFSRNLDAKVAWHSRCRFQIMSHDPCSEQRGGARSGDRVLLLARNGRA